jgi:hypothetical protein
MMDIVEWLRKIRLSTSSADWNAVTVNNWLDESANEIERLRKVLKMWVKFWEADNSIDIGGDVWLAEEAMEETRKVLGDYNVYEEK